MSEKVIELVHLQKQFGENTVLRDINLSVSKGEVLSIIGASGSGKSTMLRCINLLETPTSGQILYHGKDITGHDMNLSQYRAKVGMVFQSFNLIDELNVFENIELPLLYMGIPAAERKRRVEDAMNRMAIAHRVKHFPQQLSGGQQQRVAIARAVVANPKLILADEPTGNLDPERSMEIMTLLVKINQLGTTVLVVTHEKDLVNKFGKRVITIDQGRIINDSVGGYVGGHIHE